MTSQIDGDRRYRKVPVTVAKTFTFDAAHQLADYVGKCANLHGHTYRLDVFVRGTPDKRGIVLDFNDLKKVVHERILAPYDHKFLNDCFTFNTTAENLCVFFFDRLSQALNGITGSDARVARVRLWETPTSWAEYEGENAPNARE